MDLDLGAGTGLRRVGRQRRQGVLRAQRTVRGVVGKGRDGAAGFVTGVEKLPILSKRQMARSGAKLRRLHRWWSIWRQRPRLRVETVHDDLVEALLRDEQEFAVRRQQHAM